ncbi:MAG TPA: S-layer homology domain-containing protein [Bacillales bacterium]|nr:S-layer homology domain-containing protein [Bacillales bacterium]
MRSIFLKFLLVLSITLTLVAGNINIASAYNHGWSSHAISNFLENKVDAPDVLKDEKYLESLTREDFAELIIAFYGIATKTDKNSIELKQHPFKDTNSIDVQRAYSLGIIKGISKSEYGSAASLTREEFATMITRFLNMNGINTDATGDLNYYADKNEISKWAYSSILYCVKQGIISGVGVREPKLDPKSPITVEQALTILNRIALEYNWFTPSKDVYYSGFLLPINNELTVITDGHTTSIHIEWSKIKDYTKLENDLFYMLNSKIKDTTKTSEIVKRIMNTQFDYENGIRRDLWSDSFEIGEMKVYINTDDNDAVTWLHVE